MKKRRPGDVIIVVSDVTRPIPYSEFLGAMIAEIEAAGVSSQEIVILIATGMHRSSTQEERHRMFGTDICKRYRILDHRADEDSELLTLDTRSATGNTIRLNRHFVTAGFRIVTGLVEPHFMAGFSGGRKAVCPGLTSLDTIHHFHGYEFLADPFARNGCLEGNPCHLESLSVAHAIGVDFTLNIVLNRKRQITEAFAGEIESSHNAACAFVRDCACPEVISEYDIVVASCGGFPLDATFYQCVKGMVACLPLIKPNGVVLTVGGCREGIGSWEYRQLMQEYSRRWQNFLEDIRAGVQFRKDQWQFQMQTRILEKTGLRNLYFASEHLSCDVVEGLCVNDVSSPAGIRQAVQAFLNRYLQTYKTVAILPEGPYCTPLKMEEEICRI